MSEFKKKLQEMIDRNTPLVPKDHLANKIFNPIKVSEMTDQRKAEISSILNKYPESENALKELFPDYFKGRTIISKSPHGLIIDVNGFTMLLHFEPHHEDKYKGQCIVPDVRFNWILDYDDDGLQILIPTAKKLCH